MTQTSQADLDSQSKNTEKNRKSDWKKNLAFILILGFVYSVSVYTVYRLGWFGPVVGKPIHYSSIKSPADCRIPVPEKIEMQRKKQMEERALYCRRSSVNSSELEKNVNEFLKDYSESPVSGPDGAEKSGVGLMDGKWKDYLCSFVGKRKSDIEIKLREILDSGILSENFDIGMHGKLVIMFSMQNQDGEMIRTIRETQPDVVSEKLAEMILSEYYASDKMAFLEALKERIYNCVKTGNVVLDEERTRKEDEKRNLEIEKAIRKQIDAEVTAGTNPEETNRISKDTALTRIYKKGDVVVEVGHVLDKDVQQALKKLNADGIKFHWSVFIQSAQCILIILLFLAVYCRHARLRVAEDLSSLRFVAMVISATLVLSVFQYNTMLEIFHLVLDNTLNLRKVLPEEVWVLFLPMGLASAVIAVMGGLRSAVLAGFFVNAVLAASFLHEPRVAFSLIFSGSALTLVIGCSVQYSSNLKRYFIRSFFSGLFTVLICGALFYHEEIFQEVHDAIKAVFESGFRVPEWHQDRCFVQFMGMTLLSAAASTIYAFILISVTERISLKVTSNMTYFACTDRNQKLLMDLQSKAIGTYQHCEHVTILAKKAAEITKCNPWKIQACALYHDIGKLAHPENFTENAGGVDVYQDVAPKEGVQRIREHVEYGKELAAKYKLRSAISDGIASHHGTSFVSFFFRRAKEMDPTAELSEADFKYPGPLPSTKENAILMLADCCEAASRSLPPGDFDALEQKVSDIFSNKMQSGQLNDAPLTIRELNLIKNAFVESLKSMNHARPSYNRVEREHAENKR